MQRDGHDRLAAGSLLGHEDDLPRATATATLAAELGNLHAPIQVSDDALLTPPDGPTLSVLRRRGARLAEELRVFQPDRLLALPTIAVSGTPTGRLTTREP